MVENGPTRPAPTVRRTTLRRFLGHYLDRRGWAGRSNQIRHALGLLLVREKPIDEALPMLERAVRLAPQEPRYAYVYAVGLHSTGAVDRALKTLEETHQAHPGDRDVLAALVSFERDAGNRKAARKYAQKLTALAPGDSGALQMLKELEEAGPR